jgi:hypothetical protein
VGAEEAPAAVNSPDLQWPDGKQFAFTIVDDTDRATLDRVAPVYAVLDELGLRTTKTVWPLPFRRRSRLSGDTLADAPYRDWVLDLQERGFEIAMHGATDHSSARADVGLALDRFREVLGHDPRIHVNHSGQQEAIYWGDARLDGAPRAAYRAAQRVVGQSRSYFGHVEGSPYFWGDLCHERIEYVRNFVFRDVDTSARDPIMPYHDPRRPYVRYWFSSSEGPDVASFSRLLTEENQDRLLERRGFCVVYTHFAQGFVDGGRADRRFVELMRRLASLPGWFVPASTLLDFLRTRPEWKHNADPKALRRMQRTWLVSKLLHGSS